MGKNRIVGKIKVNTSESQRYIDVLLEEMVPAFGCTEPIAIAFAAAKATQLLGQTPTQITVACSGNIIKNVKSVVVPGSGGLRGIAVAAALGAARGNAGGGLEVLANLTKDERVRAAALFENDDFCRVELLHTPHKLHIQLTATAAEQTAGVELCGSHTRVVQATRNGEVVEQDATSATRQKGPKDRGFMSVDGILGFARTVPMEAIAPVIELQIEHNTAISNEGLRHGWGAQVGRTLRKLYGNGVENRARAAAAAGSDARMSGCELPVVINSGSGNQGMTVSLPLIEYAKELGSSRESLVRALAVSNLCAIHQKTGIGRLSAYCGAVSAAAGVSAGIAYLQGQADHVIKAAITNTLASVSGIVCDGAKPSCAAKIASAVDAALMGVAQAKNRHNFHCGEGIVRRGVEETIAAVGRLASEGMVETDTVILNIMLGEG